MATTHGIDVSKHNKTINWAMVKTSGKVNFAMLRAGYGRLVSQKDAQFEANYKGAKSVGVPIGAYWYSYALSEDEARAEADACLAVLKGKQFEYPIYYDIEEEKTLTIGKARVSSIARAFCEKMEKAGYFVGIYMSASPLTNLITDELRNRFAVWVAHVGVQKPAYSGAYGMWQYSWKGKVSGISGDVDLDECYFDYPASIKAKGLNGFTAPAPEPAKPETKEVSLTIDGATYTGTLTKK